MPFAKALAGINRMLIFVSNISITSIENCFHWSPIYV
nr:MAG TPA: hypothetical protein [Caudoviricetes sp.]